MSNPLRSKGQNTIVWVLIALLVLGLGGFGLTNFSGSIRSIGKVGQTSISINDYVRALQQEMNAVSQQIGQQVTMQQAVAFGIDRAVQEQLFANAALDEQARLIGVSVGDAEVRRQIVATGAFQGLDGKFDRQNYALTLRQQGLTEAEFEAALRAEVARLILQGAAVGGLRVPEVLTATVRDYALETRSLSYAELTPDELATPLPEPSEADLRAWHTANAAEFTSPETRDISFVWLTPEMLAEAQTADEATLLAAYQARISEFVVPERRLVEQLVFPSQADAIAARARYDAGTASFEQLVTERGLARADIDLGDVSEAELGEAGAAVFAAEVPALLGPLPSDFGPALYAVNAVLPAQDVGFAEARAELAAEFAYESARRAIAENAESYADLLAGGASLEDMARETPMQVGSLRFGPTSRGGIAAYEAFRAAAAAARPEDFAELASLEDGGVFALRLDAVNPPALIPYDEVAGAVRASWQRSQTQSRLAERAAEIVAAIAGGGRLGAQGLISTSVGKLPRGGFLEGVPAALAERAFAMQPGSAETVEAQGRVFVVVLDAVHPADPQEPEFASTEASTRQRQLQSLAQDVLALYGRAAQAEAGLNIDFTAISAVQSQLQ